MKRLVLLMIVVIMTASSLFAVVITGYVKNYRWVDVEGHTVAGYFPEIGVTVSIKGYNNSNSTNPVFAGTAQTNSSGEYCSEDFSISDVDYIKVSHQSSPYHPANAVVTIPDPSRQGVFNVNFLCGNTNPNINQ